MNQAVQTEPRFATAREISAISNESERVIIPTTLSDLAREASATVGQTTATESDESLFERFAWLYVFFRERIFRDDTERFIRTLWPERGPEFGTRLLEIGCGPGFYSCGLAARFATLSVLGVDRSARQIAWAEQKAQKLSLENCRFESDDVLDLSHTDETFDVLLAARLFTVLPDQ